MVFISQDVETTEIRRLLLRFGGYLSAQFIGQLLNLVSVPVAALFFSPYDMGVSGLILVYASTLSLIATGRYEIALTSVADSARAVSLFALATLLIFPIVLLTILPGYFLAWVFEWELSAVGGSSFWWALGALGATLSYFSVVKLWLLRGDQLKRLGRLTLWVGGVRLVALVGLGWVVPCWQSFVIAELLARLAYLWRDRHLVPGWRELVKSAHFRELKSIAKYFRDYPLLNLPSSLVNSVATVGTPVVLSQFFPVATVGQFLVSYRILIGGLSVLATAIGDVFHGALGRLVTDRRESQIQPLYYKVGAFATLAAIGLGGAMLLLLRFNAFNLIEQEWQMSVQFLPLLLPWALSQLIVWPLSRVVLVFGWLRLKLIYDCIALFGILAVAAAIRPLNLGLESVIIAISVSQTLAYIYYGVAMTLKLNANDSKILETFNA